MEFIEQIERFFDFLKSNLSDFEYESVSVVKEKFNNDYNLIGSYLKDYLTLKNDYLVCEDNKVYSEFVRYFTNCTNTKGTNYFLNDFCSFADYYLVLIFERKFHFSLIDNEILGYIETLNLFFAIELYPYLLEKLDRFLNLKIDRNIFSSVLKLLVDIVVERDIENSHEEFNLRILDYNISKMLLEQQNKTGRLVG